jgi:ASC-1-like (ASCH) protein
VTEVFHHLSLMPQYFEDICSGKKCIEGRINHGKAAKIQPGDTICFTANNDETVSVLCRVTQVNAFCSFKIMLETCGFKNFIFNATTLDEALNVYNSIPGYKERVAEHGCIAIYIKK